MEFLFLYRPYHDTTGLAQTAPKPTNGHRRVGQRAEAIGWTRCSPAVCKSFTTLLTVR